MLLRSIANALGFESKELKTDFANNSFSEEIADVNQDSPIFDENENEEHCNSLEKNTKVARRKNHANSSTRPTAHKPMRTTWVVDSRMETDLAREEKKLRRLARVNTELQVITVKPEKNLRDTYTT